MSRIGNMIITLPQGASVTQEGRRLMVNGPKGKLVRELPGEIGVRVEADKVKVTSRGIGKTAKALHGMVRAHLANDLTGVVQGWSKSLELSGVGYRANLSGANLELFVGFSHPVTIVPPPGITFAVTEGNIVISGIDKDLVGQTAANIRRVKEPEPYKGKGIKYVGEHIRKKAGKSAKTIGGAPGAK